MLCTHLLKSVRVTTEVSYYVGKVVEIFFKYPHLAFTAFYFTVFFFDRIVFLLPEWFQHSCAYCILPFARLWFQLYQKEFGHYCFGGSV